MPITPHNMAGNESFFENSSDDHENTSTTVKKTIRVSYRDSNFRDPESWKKYFHRDSSPSLVTSLKLGDCYWIPSELITNTIITFVNLDELIIRGTRLSLPHLAKVFRSCKKITNLDFSFEEEKWQQVEEAVEDDEGMEAIREGFKTLISLKIATSFTDARDYVKDPWYIIIWILRYNLNLSHVLSFFKLTVGLYLQFLPGLHGFSN